MTFLLVFSVLFELAIFYSIYRYVQFLLAAISISLTTIITVFAIDTSTVLFCLMLALLFFRIINIARFFKARMHEKYRYKVCKISAYNFGIITLLTYIFIYKYSLVQQTWFIPFTLATQLSVAFIVTILTIYNLQRFKRKTIQTYLPDSQLPTLTIAIPARNETDQLSDCLSSLLNSDYPKLEILVLDDCSQDKTAEIIKSFAQDGVRFLLGKPANHNWLAKNYAYEQLLNEASGELILFCGVDTRFGPTTVRELINTLLSNKLEMLSVLPVRHVSSPSVALIQPLRYWWEVVLPRSFFSRPPVLSTVWLIDRDILLKIGGFKAVQRSVLPEAYFAKLLSKSSKYAFYRHDQKIDVQTFKSYKDQKDTAIRMRYPQVHRRPEMVFLLVISEIYFLLLPMVFIAYSLFINNYEHFLVGLLSLALLITSHVIIVYVTNPGNVAIALFNFPVVVLTELIIVMYSMIKYEFLTISWKDRNVCIPVMHTYPHLPTLKE